MSEYGDSAFPRIEGFEVLEELGGGGMGTVYKARQLAFDRLVALKVINRGIARNPEFLRRFEDEMRVAATLQHPNIVPVYAASGLGPDPYLAMMLVRGDDLATVVRRDGPMKPDVAVAVVEQIASALDDAHAQRLIHRDVKPQNVIIDERNLHAYLTDFGLVRSLDATSGLTATGQQMGTVDYMAPEQLDGSKTVDHRADIYALGCLLYAIASGERPFTGASLGEVVREKLNGPNPPTLSERGFDPGLSEVVQRAQSARVEDRYATAGDLAKAARASLAGGVAISETVPNLARTQPLRRRPPDPRQRPTTAVPDPPPERGPRRGVILGGLAALALIGAGAAAIFVTASDSGGGSSPAPNARSAANTDQPGKQGQRQASSNSDADSPEPTSGGADCGAFSAVGPDGRFTASNIQAEGIECAEAQSMIDGGPDERVTAGWDCPITGDSTFTSCSRGEQTVSWSTSSGGADCGAFSANGPDGRFTASNIQVEGIECAEAQSMIDGGPDERVTAGWDCPITGDSTFTSCSRGEQTVSWSSAPG